MEAEIGYIYRMDISVIAVCSGSVGAMAGAVVGFILGRAVPKLEQPQVQGRTHPVVAAMLTDAADKIRKTQHGAPSWRITKAKLEGRLTPEQERAERVKQFTGESHAS